MHFLNQGFFSTCCAGLAFNLRISRTTYTKQPQTNLNKQHMKSDTYYLEKAFFVIDFCFCRCLEEGASPLGSERLSLFFRYLIDTNQKLDSLDYFISVIPLLLTPNHIYFQQERYIYTIDMREILIIKVTYRA